MARERAQFDRAAAPQMEGRAARMYARVRGTQSQITLYRQQALELTAGLRDGATILKVAPGPGYLAVEMARLRKFQVTGLDISRTMVEIATENAHSAGVQVGFRHGDAAAMPFADQSFDLVICQAAFKNFPKPLAAIDEMHRVLRPGGTAVIHDMTHDASGAAISEEVRGMHLAWLPSLVTRFSLVGLRRRAYTPAAFSQLAQHSAFKGCEIKTAGIGMTIRMTRGAGR